MENKRIKSAGRYNLSILIGAKENQRGFLKTWFVLNNSYKDKATGEYKDSDFYTLEDLYALRSLIDRSIVYAEDLLEADTAAKKPRDGDSSKEQADYDDEDIPL